MKSIARLATLLTLLLMSGFQSPALAAADVQGQQVFRIVVPPKVQTRISNNQFQLHSSVPVGIQATTILKSGRTDRQTQIYVPGPAAFRFDCRHDQPAASTVLTICPL